MEDFADVGQPATERRLHGVSVTSGVRDRDATRDIRNVRFQRAADDPQTRRAEHRERARHSDPQVRAVAYSASSALRLVESIHIYRQSAMNRTSDTICDTVS